MKYNILSSIHAGLVGFGIAIGQPVGAAASEPPSKTDADKLPPQFKLQTDLPTALRRFEEECLATPVTQYSANISDCLTQGIRLNAAKDSASPPERAKIERDVEKFGSTFRQPFYAPKVGS